MNEFESCYVMPLRLVESHHQISVMSQSKSPRLTSA